MYTHHDYVVITFLNTLHSTQHTDSMYTSLFMPL